MDFEVEAAEALGLSLTSGSGNKAHDRSDAKGRIRLSCKSTAKRTWAQTRAQLREAIDMAAGTGEAPLLAIQDDDGETFLVMRLTDGAAVLTDDARPTRRVRRSDVIRETSSIPVLLRGGEDDVN